MTDARLPKYSRVLNRRDFLRIQNRGKKLRSAHLLVSVLKNDQAESSRIGITITRKVDKRAVQRNRFKRIIREFFRQHRFQLASGLDIVVIGLNGVTSLANAAIRSEFETLLQKGRLLKKS